MKKFGILALIILLLISGCVSKSGDSPEISPTVKNSTTTGQLKSDLELEFEFNCDRGVHSETSVSNLIIWTCAKDYYSIENKDAAGGIYLINAHPGGDWLVTYIVYDNCTGNYSEVRNADDLKHFFVPIKNEDEAVKYVYLHEGLDMIPSVPEGKIEGITSAVKTETGFNVTIMHKDWIMCPCYGTYMKNTYEVTADGVITKIPPDIAYSFQKDCIC